MAAGHGGQSTGAVEQDLDRLLFDQVRDLVVLTAPDWTLLDANRAAHGVLGYEPGELQGREMFEVIAPESRDSSQRRLARVFAGEADMPEESALLTRDGRRIPVEVSSTPVTRDGEVVAAMCICRDLSARKRMETALRTSAARLRDAFEKSPVGMSIVAPDGTILQANAALAEITGYHQRELVGLTYRDLTHPDDVAEDIATVDAVLAGESVTHRRDKRYVRKDGRTIWVRVTSSLVRTADGEPLHFVTQTTDITDQHEAHEAVRRSETMLAEAQRVAQLGSCNYDVATETMTWSEELYRIYGLDRDAFDLTYENVLGCVHPDDRARVHDAMINALRTRQPFGLIHRIVRPDGSIRVAESRGTVLTGEDGKPQRMTGTTRDVTEAHEANEERRLLRAELVHVHKMEAIGTLAGGVAHDFNNALTAIRGYAELVLSELDPSTDAWRDADALRRVAEHAASLPRQLLAFARRQTLQPRELDVGAVVAEAEGLLAHVLGSACTLRVDRGRATAGVLCDPGQLQLVLVNLALNARDAMASGGEFTVGTAVIELDEPSASALNVPPGRYARLTAADTGRGMDEATRSQALEPFFSTKEPGEGTGLGLATVYGIVTQSGGTVTIESEPGQGTTVQILLPAIDVPTAAERGPAEAEAPGSARTILLVEDEPAVLGVSQRALERAGY
jgi:PAS domain S-box-containing protein